MLFFITLPKTIQLQQVHNSGRRWLNFFALFLLPIVLGAWQLSAQEQRYGYPLMQYYSPKSYNASDQNWCVLQDATGMLYFGNTDKGVLVYDGARWSNIRLETSQLVRDLAKGETGIIYVGTIGDFGRLVPTSQGELRYESLLPTVRGELPDFQDIYKVHALNGRIFFCAKGCYFIYDEQRQDTRVFSFPNDKNFLTFRVGDELVAGVDGTNLLFCTDSLFRQDTIIYPPGMARAGSSGRQLYGAVAISPDTLLLGYSPGGVFIYDRKKSAIVEPSAPFAPNVQKIIAQGANIYTMHRLRNGNVAVGLIFSDDVCYAEFTPDGRDVQTLGITSGLHDSFVMEFTETSDGTLWLTHNVGLTSIEANAPFRAFTELHGLNSVVLSLHEHRGTLYVGSMNGLFRVQIEGGHARLVQVPGIYVPVWQMVSYTDPYDKREVLLVQGMTDTYQVDGERGYSLPMRVSDPATGEYVNPVRLAAYGGYVICPLATDPRVVALGMQSGVKFLRRLPNNAWFEEKVEIHPPITAEVRDIAQDGDSTIWLSTFSSGVYLMEKQRDGSYRTRQITERQGIPSLRQNMVTILNGKPYITTQKGFMVYDRQADTLLPASLPITPNLGAATAIARGETWAMQRFDDELGLNLVEYYKNIHDTTSPRSQQVFKRLPSRWLDAIAFDQKGTLWLGFANELFSYRSHIPMPQDSNFRAIIRSVMDLKNDSTLFAGVFHTTDAQGRIRILMEQPEEMVLKLPYSQNSLYFQFGANAYSSVPTEYSVILENNDAQWSKWENRAEATYTNLREGSYTLKVRAKNAYGQISEEAHYTIVIKPPFYRTIWAYIAYIILFSLLVWGLVQLNSRRILAEKRRLEKVVKERTAEVVKQKEQIEQQNNEIVSSITYASKIQQAILPRQATIQSIFPEHLLLYLPRNVVSGDFYWMIQIGDKKVCCIADCTGHGVPGGFMSMLGSTFLHQVVRSVDMLDTAEILNLVRELVISSLHQTDDVMSNKDGMDCALFIIDESTGMLQYSGANNPLIHIRDGEMTELKPDRMPIGIYIRAGVPFTSQTIQLQKGDMLYAFSDGYQDQFGGLKNRKFMIKNLRALLLEIYKEPVEVQNEIVAERFAEWKGEHPQTDDVILFGIRI